MWVHIEISLRTVSQKAPVIRTNISLVRRLTAAVLWWRWQHRCQLRPQVRPFAQHSESNLDLDLDLDCNGTLDDSMFALRSELIRGAECEMLLHLHFLCVSREELGFVGFVKSRFN